MGCSASQHRKRVGDTNGNSVQDEARSFRSKVDAMRFITKNQVSRQALLQYLEETKEGVEFLTCFIDLEDIKLQPRDDAFVALVTSTVTKYKILNDKAEAHELPNGAVIEIIWEKLRRLRQLDLKATTKKKVLETLNAVQNQLLGELSVPFEKFLESPQYFAWRQNQNKLEKDHAQVGHTINSVHHSNHIVSQQQHVPHPKVDGGVVRPASLTTPATTTAAADAVHATPPPAAAPQTDTVSLTPSTPVSSLPPNSSAGGSMSAIDVNLNASDAK
jgi:hypothetical protein